VLIVSPSKADTALVAFVAGAAVVARDADVAGTTVAAEVTLVAGLVVGTFVIVLVVVVVVAIGAASPEIGEPACEESEPAKKYASPPVVAQLATRAPTRAPRAG